MNYYNRIVGGTGLLLILLFITLNSCQWTTAEPALPQIPDGPVSYSSDIQKIFDDKCISCHDNKKPVLISDVSYTNLVNGDFVDTDMPESSPLYIQLNSGHPGGAQAATPTENAYILKWIEQGALDN